tara:strand:+ start:1090 stop:1332 length:243 start_codon:yes stop_codon:yes gene_type:complete
MKPIDQYTKFKAVVMKSGRFSNNITPQELLVATMKFGVFASESVSLINYWTSHVKKTGEKVNTIELRNKSINNYYTLQND